MESLRFYGDVRWGGGDMDSPIRNFLEIEITTACNLKCFNCDRQCRQAPSSEHMSLEQIYHFLDEINNLGYEFECITLLGGEPLIHPDLSAILVAFAEYDIKPAFVTNGYGNLVKRRMASLETLGFSICDTGKVSTNQPYFDRMNIAPKDYGLKATPCWIPHSCGYGLNRYGFYPCGAGASIDRVMGFDIGIKSLKNIKETIESMKTLCQYCGHSDAAKKIPEDIQTSPSWARALERYRQSPPKLTLYGEGGVVNIA